MFPKLFGRWIQTTSVDRVIKPVLKANGLEWKGWHAYRRGLATNLHEQTLETMELTSGLGTAHPPFQAGIHNPGWPQQAPGLFTFSMYRPDSASSDKYFRMNFWTPSNSPLNSNPSLSPAALRIRSKRRLCFLTKAPISFPTLLLVNILRIFGFLDTALYSIDSLTNWGMR
jgi:hypothetical protein